MSLARASGHPAAHTDLNSSTGLYRLSAKQIQVIGDQLLIRAERLHRDINDRCLSGQFREARAAEYAEVKDILSVVSPESAQALP